MFMRQQSILCVGQVRLTLLVAAGLAILACASVRAEDAVFDINWLPGSVALRGVTHVRPDTWCIAGSKIYNPTEQDIEPLLAISFRSSPHVQFTRRIWVPPKSKRSIQVPLRTPLFTDDRFIEVEVDLLDDSESALGGDRGLFRVDHVRPAMGVLADVDDGFSQRCATAIRLASRLPRAKSSFRELDLPPVFIGYQGVDNLLIARDKPDPDPAQLVALRQWLLSGGRLWIMAEQVDPHFVEKLLGDSWTCHVVDYVELNHVHITGGNRGGAQMEFELPVRMARMLTSGWQVVHQVRGWPASFHKRVGLGSVLVTTVGPRAWYRLMTSPPPPPGDKTPRRAYVETAREPLHELAKLFNVSFEPPPLPQESMAQLARSQIGFQTLSRTPVAVIFLLFIVGLLISALILARARLLEHSAWVGSLLAVGVSVILLVLMRVMQTPIPLTISEANVIRVIPRTGYAVVDGSLAVFSPQGGKGPLQGIKGGAIFPDLQTQRNELVRVQTDDLGRWVWDGVVLPTRAFLNAATRHIVKLENSAAVQLTFDEKGAVATISPSELEPLEDIVVATANGFYVPSLIPNRDGTVRISEKQRLVAGQYIGGQTMGSVQLRHQQMYQDMFEPVAHEIDGKSIRQLLPVSQPVLAAWCKSLDLGYRLPQQHETKKISLMILPVDLIDVPVGTRVTVPSGFISYSLDSGPTGEGTKTVFDVSKRLWIPVNASTVVVLRFQLPRQVLPLDITGGTWTVDIDAPGRSVRAYYFADNQRVEMPATSQPRLQAHLDRHAELITHDDDGNLYLALEIGDASGSTAPWQIKDVQLQLRGQVMAANVRR